MTASVNPLAMASLMPLLSRQASELSLMDIQTVANVFGKGQIVTEEQKELALALLKSENIDKVADILSRPDLMEKLKSFLTPPQQKSLGIIQCPHCFVPFLLEPQA